jgi:hypothetical protein
MEKEHSFINSNKKQVTLNVSKVTCFLEQRSNSN